MTSEALIQHYQAVADGSPVPVLLYNFLALTGVNLLPAAVARLADHPNIVGVKESGGDMTQVAAYIDQTPDEFEVLVGSAPTFYTSLCLGATGGILALACLVPELCLRMYQLVMDGKHAEARDLQRQVTPLARSISSTYGVPGLKAALDLLGLRGGPPRPPLLPAPPAAIGEIRGQLESLGQLA
jgi:4-hydroxy-2-oxoglutarate aldolase